MCVCVCVCVCVHSYVCESDLVMGSYFVISELHQLELCFGPSRGPHSQIFRSESFSAIHLRFSGTQEYWWNLKGHST